MSSCNSLSYKDCLNIEEQLKDLKNNKGGFTSPRYYILEHWMFEMSPKDLYKSLTKYNKPNKIIKILEENDIVNWLHYYFLCIVPSIVSFEDCKGICKHECILWFFCNDDERKYIPSVIKPIQKNWVYRDKPNRYQGWYYKQLLLIKKVEYVLLKFIYIYKKFKSNDMNKHMRKLNSILVDIQLCEYIVEYVDNRITHKDMINAININHIGLINDYTDNVGIKECKDKNISSFRKNFIKTRQIS